MILSKSDIERFWSKVGKRAIGECWEWTGSADKRYGYGKLSVSTSGKERVFLAHRISFQLSNGEFPEEMKICHKCDNPPCVNPSHLFLGTDSDNMKDKVAKNRQSKGLDAVNHYKINQEIADKIRERRKQGLTYRELIEEFGLSKSSISYIVNNKIWNF